MPYVSRIPADDAYLVLAGRALYNFTYLEWIIIYTIVRLSADGFQSVPMGKTAAYIARALITAIATTSPTLPEDLRLDLIELHKKFLSAITVRNKLLHSHPFTAEDGTQQLGGGGKLWTPETLEGAAMHFEEVAIGGAGILHGKLAAVRP